MSDTKDRIRNIVFHAVATYRNRGVRLKNRVMATHDPHAHGFEPELEWRGAPLDMLRAPLKALNNPKFIQALALLVLGPDERRPEALAGLAEWVRTKNMAAPWPRAEDSARGAAADLLAAPALRSQLASTLHFGALSGPLMSVDTRLDYIAVQLHQMDRLKRALGGLGLSSTLQGTDDIEYDGKPVSGLSIIQCWAVLLNAGHLFGTFSTERALLYSLRGSPAARAAVLEALPQPLRKVAEMRLGDASMYNIHQVLACHRVARCGLSDPLRDFSVRALQLYLQPTPSPRIEALKAIYKRQRQLAYLIVQDRNPSITLDTKKLHTDGALKEMLVESDFAGETLADHPTPLALLADALDQFYYRTVFTGHVASQTVVHHLRCFRAWWNTRGGDDGGEGTLKAIDDLFGSQPKDWPSLTSRDYKWSLRITVPVTSTNWHEEVKKWRGHASTWPGATFYLAHPPTAEEGVALILAEDAVPPPDVLCGVALQLARYSKEADPANNAGLWRGNGRLLAAALKLSFKPDLRIALRPVRAPRRLGYAVIRETIAEAHSAVEAFTALLTSNEGKRQKELVALHQYLGGLDPDERPAAVVVALGEVRLVQADDSDLTDLDGLIALVYSWGIEWHVLEVKDGANPLKQLQRTSSQLLVTPEPPVKLNKPGTSVGLLKFRWLPGNPPRA